MTKALGYIFYLDECVYANEFNEVPPRWLELLNRCMALLGKYSDAIHSASAHRIIETGKELQQRLTPLVFHKITGFNIPHKDA